MDSSLINRILHSCRKKAILEGLIKHYVDHDRYDDCNIKNVNAFLLKSYDDLFVEDDSLFFSNQQNDRIILNAELGVTKCSEWLCYKLTRLSYCHGNFIGSIVRGGVRKNFPGV